MTDSAAPAFSQVATDAVVFWERGRVLYNLILVAVSLLLIGGGLFTVGLGYPWGELVILALIANLLYTSAYLPDLVLQFAPWRSLWRHARWVLWTLGTMLSCWIASGLIFVMRVEFG